MSKCNFRTMGKKYGKLMKGVAAAMSTLSQDEINDLETNGQIKLMVEGQEIVVVSEDVEIISEDIPGWLVANDGNITVALEVEISDELRKEGMARELINRVQNIRKDNGLEITDRVSVMVSPSPQLTEAIEAFNDYIKSQVLADEIVIGQNEGTEVEFDDFNANIMVNKINNK